MFLFAQADGLAWVSPVIQLVTAGGFGALVWYLVIKHIPSIEDRHKGERGEWLSYIQKRDADFENISRECLGAVVRANSEMERLQEKIDEVRNEIRPR